MARVGRCNRRSLGNALNPTMLSSRSGGEISRIAKSLCRRRRRRRRYGRGLAETGYDPGVTQWVHARIEVGIDSGIVQWPDGVRRQNGRAAGLGVGVGDVAPGVGGGLAVDALARSAAGATGGGEARRWAPCRTPARRDVVGDGSTRAMVCSPELVARNASTTSSPGSKVAAAARTSAAAAADTPSTTPATADRRLVQTFQLLHELGGHTEGRGVRVPHPRSRPRPGCDAARQRGRVHGPRPVELRTLRPLAPVVESACPQDAVAGASTAFRPGNGRRPRHATRLTSQQPPSTAAPRATCAVVGRTALPVSTVVAPSAI